MNLLYVTLAGTLGAAIALRFAIPALVQRARLDELARLPIVAEHLVVLPAGQLILHLVGPLGRGGLGTLSIKLIDTSGTAVPSWPILVRSRVSSGLRDVVLAVRRFQIPAADLYRLVVDGIPETHEFSDCRWLFARPHGGRLAASIIAVVVAAVALVFCSVLLLILWLSPPAVAAQASAGEVLPRSVIPDQGTRERAALIDAVRSRAGLAKGASRLRVHHLKVSGRWAYFAGNELVRVERAQWQETDLSIQALLVREVDGWRVLEYWSLPTEARRPRRVFDERVQQWREREGIPESLFPEVQ